MALRARLCRRRLKSHARHGAANNGGVSGVSPPPAPALMPTPRARSTTSLASNGLFYFTRTSMKRRPQVWMLTASLIVQVCAVKGFRVAAAPPAWDRRLREPGLSEAEIHAERSSAAACGQSDSGFALECDPHSELHLPRSPVGIGARTGEDPVQPRSAESGGAAAVSRRTRVIQRTARRSVQHAA